MEKFKEKRIVNILYISSMISFLLFFISLFLTLVSEKFILGFFFIIFSAILAIIASSLSGLDKFTNKFIDYIKERLKSAKTIEELKEIRTDFENIAIEGRSYCLKYPVTLREVHSEILYKIDILEKQ